MCGIFGWQLRDNNLPTSEKLHILAVALGWQNEIRGTDSYGWANPVSGEMHKGLGRIGPYARLMAQHRSILGHTRNATKGAVTIPNAHPWVFGRVLGAHNGMVYNHEDINKSRKEKGLPEREVDSMHIFDMLDKGMDLGELRGYGSIEWVEEERKDRIYLCRITERSDLGVVQSEHGAFWSSDIEHLEEAMIVAGLRYTRRKIDQGKVYYAREGTVYLLPDVELKFSEFQTTYTYGSTQQKREDDTEDWVMAIMAANGHDSDSESFPFLSKKERRRLIMQRNIQIAKAKSSGGSERFLVYKDLCRCGAYVGLGQTHFDHCDRREQAGLIKCHSCKSEDDRHFYYCPTLNSASHVHTVVSQVQNEVKELQGIFVGSTWACPDCQNPPQVDNQMCPKGHGRVVGQVTGL